MHREGLKGWHKRKPMNCTIVCDEINIHIVYMGPIIIMCQVYIVTSI